MRNNFRVLKLWPLLTVLILILIRTGLEVRLNSHMIILIFDFKSFLNFEGFDYGNNSNSSYLTTNQMEYEPKSIQQVSSYKPDPRMEYYNHYSNVPFYGETTHRSDYGNFYANPNQSTNDNAGISTANQPTYNYSNNNQYDYNLAPTVDSGNNDYSSNKAPFYGESTHRSDYGPKVVSKTESFKPDNTVDPYNQAPFYGETTHRSSYNYQNVEKAQSYKVCTSKLNSVCVTKIVLKLIFFVSDELNLQR